jgi:uncharacterized membrane protein YphA (DoxX/SURF4 family)
MAGEIRKPWVPIIATLFLAAVFIAAGVLKIPHPDALYASIRQFRLVNSFWALVGAYVFPWAEFWAGVGLCFGRSRRTAALVICALMVLFIAVVLQAWARGLDIHCGCFGSSDDLSPDNYPALLFRDVGLLLLGVFLAFKKRD